MHAYYIQQLTASPDLRKAHDLAASNYLRIIRDRFGPPIPLKPGESDDRGSRYAHEAIAEYYAFRVHMVVRAGERLRSLSRELDRGTIDLEGFADGVESVRTEYNRDARDPNHGYFPVDVNAKGKTERRRSGFLGRIDEGSRQWVDNEALGGSVKSDFDAQFPVVSDPGRRGGP